MQAQQTTVDLRAHQLIYYAEHSLGVASLEGMLNKLLEPAGSFYSSSALAQAQSCHRGVGEALRRTDVQAVVRALRMPNRE